MPGCTAVLTTAFEAVRLPVEPNTGGCGCLYDHLDGEVPATMVVDEAVGQLRRSGVIEDERFTRRLYTVAGAARLVGMSPSTLRTWSHGYERRLTNSKRVSQGPVITALENGSEDQRSIPFIGLVEAAVVQAFRNTGLPLQRIRKALEILANEGELEHALASRQLFSDGASVLYDYATRSQDKQLRLLTVVHTGQRVFHEVIGDYLERITFGDTWATELILPVTDRPYFGLCLRSLGETQFLWRGAQRCRPCGHVPLLANR